MIKLSMIYTLGHSTLSQEKFLELTKDIQTILDVRSHPGSKWPQFNKEELEKWLPAVGKKYIWEPRLGGWTIQHLHLAEEFKKHGVDILPYMIGKFPKQVIAKKKLAPNEKPAWTNQGLFDYSYITILPEYRLAINELIERGKSENVAFMCAECLYFRCHRSMISDYLWFRGVDTTHLMLKAKPLQHSSVILNRFDRYETYIIDIWKKYRDEDKLIH